MNTTLLIAFAVATVFLFTSHKLLHNYLDTKWHENPDVPYPNGNGEYVKLFLLNGCGMKFNGRYRECMIGEQLTYVTYYTFVLVWIPIASFRCYRVISDGDNYRILGSEKTRFSELFCLLLFTAGVLSAIATVGSLFGMF